jgi:hypothetical protein
MKIASFTICILLCATNPSHAQVGSGGFPPLSSRETITSGKSEPERASQLQVTTTAVYSGTLQRAPWAAWKEDDDEP